MINPDKFQLGITAASMLTLPDPMPGIDEPMPNVGGRRTSLAGALTVQSWAKKRAWTLQWNLTDAQFPTVWQFWDGTKGLGPFILNDPQLTYQPVVNFADDPEHAVPYRGAHTVTFSLREV